MTRLKLFVSHSSRLDDVYDHGLPLEANWQLLDAVCKAIKAKYGETVHVSSSRYANSKRGSEQTGLTFLTRITGHPSCLWATGYELSCGFTATIYLATIT